MPVVEDSGREDKAGGGGNRLDLLLAEESEASEAFREGDDVVEVRGQVVVVGVVEDGVGDEGVEPAESREAYLGMEGTL